MTTVRFDELQDSCCGLEKPTSRALIKYAQMDNLGDSARECIHGSRAVYAKHKEPQPTNSPLIDTHSARSSPKRTHPPELIPGS